MEKTLNTSPTHEARTAEQLSALYDGNLSASQARALVRQSLADGGQTLGAWRSYSTLSEHMPSPDAAQVTSLPDRVAVPNAVASNDSVFRWKITAAVAAFAAAGSLVWNVVSLSSADSAQVLARQVDKAPATTQVVASNAPSPATPEPVMLRDPRLDALMAAHRQFGGVSALQQGAGALHSVSLVTVRP